LTGLVKVIKVMKTICIYHSRDLDGWMSAAIVMRWFMEQHEEFVVRNSKDIVNSNTFGNDPAPELFMLGWDYGDEIPKLSDYDKVIMCDISFPTFEDFVGGFELIWIDHHKSAIEKVEQGILENSAHIEGLRDVKFAACELTWVYFFPAEPMPEIVRLLGRYDCFGHKGTGEEQKVLEFQYGARAVMSNYKECYIHLNKSIKDSELYENEDLTVEGDILSDGGAIYNYLKAEAKQIYSKAFEVWFDDGVQTSAGNSYKFLCVNQDRFNPINFGIDYHKENYDGFACFWYKGGKWNFSLYNDNGAVDCSVIAKQFGGGGHAGASGFLVDDIHAIIG